MIDSFTKNIHKKDYCVHSKFFWFCVLLIIGFAACQSIKKTNMISQDPYAHIESKAVKKVLQKSFDRIGGLKRWNNKPSLSFEKYFALYDEAGAIEKSLTQQHDYRYTPTETIAISWQADNEQHQIVSTNGQPIKTINGKIEETAKERALKNSILTATFVVDIPFKLLDKNVVLTYLGKDTLEDQQVVEVIRAEYDPAQHAHHTTPDIWWYYFDYEDYRLHAYMVQHLDHISYVKNLEFTEVGGFLFTTKRKSYRVDQDRNILYLRADYEYRDYKVE